MYEETIFLFIDGQPRYHSDDIDDVVRYIFDEIGEIESVY